MLDWGLGHATRSVPIIQGFLDDGAHVTIAGAGRAGDLLQKEFPQLHYIGLPAYNPSYTGGDMVLGMAKQTFHFLKVIDEEHKLLQSLIDQHKFDLVISDGRFGMHTTKRPCIMIAHQIALQMPGLMKLTEPLVNLKNRSYLDKYTEVWIPDHGTAQNLSGRLSHIANLPDRYQFIGPLSRLMPTENKTIAESVLVLLSGPEPQRTHLQHIIEQQAAELPYQFTIVEGRPEETKTAVAHDKGIRNIPYLTSKELSMEISKADIVVCRSGYSSIMDLAALGKKALLIPTPGQTEQEYLAEHLSQNSNFVVQQQNKLNLQKGLDELTKKEPDSSLSGSRDHYHGFIRLWMQRLNS